MKAYLFLAIAISSELFDTSMLKASTGFTKFWPSLGVLLGVWSCFLCAFHIASAHSTQRCVCHLVWRRNCCDSL